MATIPGLAIVISAELVAGDVIITYPVEQAQVVAPSSTDANARACINSRKHGRAVKGGRCQRCWDAKRANDKVRDQALRVKVA